MEKVGLQTIIFGRRIDDLDGVLGLIRAAGYHGVEFSQAPRLIREMVNGSPTPVHVHRLVDMLKAHELVFLGLSGGSIQERMKYCTDGGATARPLYLYIETCDEATLQSAADGRFRLALHPHAFMPNHQIDQAIGLLHNLKLASTTMTSLNADEATAYGRLYWLPDTGHIFVVGRRFEDAIEKLDPGQIIAVHLKDWDAAYGRSYHRYARGFTELGKGNVRPEQALALLRGLNYSGWIVVEQDYTKISAKKSIYENALWLRDHDVPVDPVPPREYAGLNQPTLVQPDGATWPLDSLNSGFVQAIGQDLNTAYSRIAAAFARSFECNLVTVWACSQARDNMSLLAAEPHIDLPYRVAKQELLGSSIDLLEIEKRQLRGGGSHPATGSVGTLFERAAALGAKTVVGFPVPNRYNPHHVRLFVAVFVAEDCQALRLPDDTLERLFEVTARGLASCLDSVLDDHCEYAAGKVNLYASNHESVTPFLKELIEQICGDVQCQAATIFQLSSSEDRMHRPVSTGLAWTVPGDQRFYTLDDKTFVSTVWRNKEPLFTDASYELKSAETKDVDANRSDLLGVPLLTPNGKVLGVVRCRNKRVSNSFSPDFGPIAGAQEVNYGSDRAFTDDDAAIVDSACNAAMPHLKLLRNDLLRANAAKRLTHELKAPIAILRHAIDALETSMGTATPDQAGALRATYVADISRLTNLISRLIGNVDILGGKYRPLELLTSPTSLRDEVIMPSVRHAGALLWDRNFDVRRVVCRYLEGIPRLHVDQTLFLQVFFNLLANSIKFAYDDPNLFRIEVDGRRDGRQFRIFFRDWGPGISEGQQERIFGEELRGPEFLNKIVTGQGLGLWIVRRIVRGHGGDVVVTKLSEPTEFTITLPQRLESGPPLSQSAADSG